MHIKPVSTLVIDDVRRWLGGIHPGRLENSKLSWTRSTKETLRRYVRAILPINLSLSLSFYSTDVLISLAVKCTLTADVRVMPYADTIFIEAAHFGANYEWRYEFFTFLVERSCLLFLIACCSDAHPPALLRSGRTSCGRTSRTSSRTTSRSSQRKTSTSAST